MLAQFVVLESEIIGILDVRRLQYTNDDTTYNKRLTERLISVSLLNYTSMS